MTKVQEEFINNLTVNQHKEYDYMFQTAISVDSLKKEIKQENLTYLLKLDQHKKDLIKYLTHCCQLLTVDVDSTIISDMAKKINVEDPTSILYSIDKCEIKDNLFHIKGYVDVLKPLQNDDKDAI